MQLQAVFEGGVIRPLEPVDLPEGELIEVIVLSHNGNARVKAKPAQILARIAALPSEGATDAFSGQHHDRILYPANESCLQMSNNKEHAA